MPAEMIFFAGAIFGFILAGLVQRGEEKEREDDDGKARRWQRNR